MKKRIIIAIILITGFLTAIWAYRLFIPLGVLFPTKWMSATMQTQGQTIRGTVYRGKYWHLLFVHYPDSSSFTWFTIDMKNSFVALPNGPRKIIGNIYRPMGIGVNITSDKVGEKWHVTVDGERAVFSNAVIHCTVGKGSPNQ